MNELTFTVIVSFGSYDDKTTVVCYAGSDYKSAINAAKKSEQYTPDDNRYIEIVAWRNGEQVAYNWLENGKLAR